MQKQKVSWLLQCRQNQEENEELNSYNTAM